MVGGLVGSDTIGGDTGTTTNSFWDKQTSGRTTSAGGTGKTTAAMMTESTFTSAGWDFEGETANGTDDIWTICSFGGNYPRLWWEQTRVYHVSAADGNDDNNGSSGGTAFATIQAGIGAALGGEEVLVWPGVYSEAIDFDGKAITVQGVDTEAGVAIVETPLDYAFSFYTEEGPNTVLKNFVVRDSYVAVFLIDASPTISNLTIVDNQMGIEAYGGAGPDISNCIFHNNTNGDLAGCQAQYSCIETGGVGLGNINSDPCFVDANNGDYRLKSEGWRWDETRATWTWDDVTSLCIDAGNPGTPLRSEPESIAQDPNNIWGVNIRVNMGAYGGTSQASIPPHGWALLADLNNDGIVDWLDAGLWVQYWLAADSELPADLDRNGTIDGFDWALFGQDWSSETLWR
jgi:parallel beta-helix repeat protein